MHRDMFCATLVGLVSGVIVAGAVAQVPDYLVTNFVWERDQGGTGGPGSVAADVAVTPDGSRMVFSSSGSIASGCMSNSQGIIYIYDYNDATGLWEFNHQIKNCTYQAFGQSLAISDDGSTIGVGVNTAGWQNGGGAYVYEEVGGAWTLAYETTATRIYGTPVDLSNAGDLLIAVSSEQLGSYLTIHRRDAGGAWSQVHREDWIPLGPSNLNYNALVSIDGDWAVVKVNGAAGNRLRVLRYDGGLWTVAQHMPYPAASGTPGSGPFASDVEIDGDRMIVGVGDCCGAPGVVRIYELDHGTGQWAQVFEEVGAAGDTLGYDVDILGDRAVAAREARNDARLYERVNGVWRFDQVLAIPGSTDYGRSVAIMERGYLFGGTTTIGNTRALVAELAEPAPMCSLVETFDGLTDLPPSLFGGERPCSLRYIENDTLVLERPGSCTEYNNAVSAYGDLILGDFALSFDWETEPLPFLFSGQNAFPAAVQVFDGVTHALEMRLERVQVDTLLNGCEPSPGFHKCWDRVAGSDTCASSNRVSASLVASYRITRQGSTWRAYVKEPGDADWVLLRSATLSEGPVRFALEQLGSVGGTKTRFDNLVLTVDACECPADLSPPPDGDGVVNTNDFFQFLAYYQAQDDRADFTGEGEINTNDFFAFLASYQGGCP